MKVLLFEQWWGGHYTNYLNCLVPRLARIADHLVIAIDARALQSPEAKAWAAFKNVEFAEAVPWVHAELDVKGRKAVADNLRRTVRSVQPNLTMVPTVDAQAPMLGLMNASGMRSRRQLGRVEGTFHEGYGFSARGAKERLKEVAYAVGMRHGPFDVLNFVNFTYYDYVLQRRIVAPEKVRLVATLFRKHCP